MADQFDAVIHIDETRAVEPLERTAGWEMGVPETYPVGLQNDAGAESGPEAGFSIPLAQSP